MSEDSEDKPRQGLGGPRPWEARAVRVLRAVDEHGLSRRMSRWLGRGVAKIRLRRIGLWYHQDYAGVSPALSARVPHVDVHRGRKVLEFLEARGLLNKQDVSVPSPMPLQILLAVHSEEYLERVTKAENLARIFALDKESVDVDAILRSQRRAAGGTYQASRWAIARQGRLAFNLGGGFHHAEPDKGGGFCVYNDIAATIEYLRSQGYESPIAIVDLDYHQGNGNTVAFANDASVLTYSLHGAEWAKVDARANIDVRVPPGCNDTLYMQTLRETLAQALEAQRPALLFYIAGTDVLSHDALGDLGVSMQGALMRDRFVIEWARRNHCSTVVLLGGGYSSEAWLSSAKMVEWALTGRDPSAINEDVRVRRRFGKIAESLDPYELQKSDQDWPRTEADWLSELDGVVPSSLVLGYYSVDGIELAFERYGFLNKLREQGFSDFRLEIDPSDPDRQRICVYGQKGVGVFHLLVEMLVCKRNIAAPPIMGSDRALEMLSVEWLLLQNPTIGFTPGRGPMPGQKYPGLGVLRELMEMLYQACLRLGLDGVVVHPSRFHISAVGAAHLRFLDPAVQGRFEAIRDKLDLTSMVEISQLLDDNRLRHDDGSLVEWEPVDYVAPVSERLKAYLESPGYEASRLQARREARLAGIAVAGSPAG